MRVVEVGERTPAGGGGCYVVSLLEDPAFDPAARAAWDGFFAFFSPSDCPGLVVALSTRLATNSMATNSAASPTRRRVLLKRVYPPGRSPNRAATSLNTFDTAVLLRRKP